MNDFSDLAERILDSAGDAIIFADGAGAIRRWSRAAAALFGFAAEEALGKSLEIIIPDHLRAAHWRGFDAAINSGALRLEGRPTLTRATHKSGRKLYVETDVRTGLRRRDISGGRGRCRPRRGRSSVERERAATQSKRSRRFCMMWIERRLSPRRGVVQVAEVS